MKISYRILLINFAVVVAILASSAIAIYSVMYSIITSQQSRYLKNSASNFIYNYQALLQESEEEFLFFEKNGFNPSLLNKQKNIDFLLLAADDSSDQIQILYSNDFVNPVDSVNTFASFFSANPYSLSKNVKVGDQKFYFGRVLNEKVLNSVSQRIGAEVALIWNNAAVEVSNSSVTRKYFGAISSTMEILKKEDNFKTLEIVSGDDDIIATKYNPENAFGFKGDLQFVIFSGFTEASDFRTGFFNILLLIGATGVVLSLILTMIFTDRIRKQIKKLSNATDVIKKGDFSQRITVQTKDELGQLGNAFNTMLDVLAKNEQAKNEYSEFITLINRNPTLTEISESALAKISKSCGYNVGILYLVEDSDELHHMELIMISELIPIPDY
jgi:HAMP domain-containing protein